LLLLLGKLHPFPTSPSLYSCSRPFPPAHIFAQVMQRVDPLYMPHCAQVPPYKGMNRVVAIVSRPFVSGSKYRAEIRFPRSMGTANTSCAWLLLRKCVSVVLSALEGGCSRHRGLCYVCRCGVFPRSIGCAWLAIENICGVVLEPFVKCVTER
jgi:hypothetical protein